MTSLGTQALSETTPLPAMPRGSRVRSVVFQGPEGRLEALLNEGAPNARFAALVCHPHPLGGGTMHNKVVYHAMKVLNDPVWGLNLPVLRFNFRGAGLSDGAHHGQAESEDVLAALGWIENEFMKPVVMVGFSFGAAMALRACCQPSMLIRPSKGGVDSHPIREERGKDGAPHSQNSLAGPTGPAGSKAA